MARSIKELDLTENRDVSAFVFLRRETHDHSTSCGPADVYEHQSGFSEIQLSYHKKAAVMPHAAPPKYTNPLFLV